MRTRLAPALLAIGLLASAVALPSRPALAQAGAVVSAGGDLIKALERFVAQQPEKTLAGEIGTAGGAAAIRDLSARIVAEGGDAALAQAARITQALGPAAIRMLAAMPHTAKLLAALDGLPPDILRQAVNALARGADGRALADAVDRFGPAVLKLEVEQPGLAVKLAQDLGPDGIALARQLPSDGAVVLARHSAEIAALPEAQKSAVLALAMQKSAAFIGFLEAHPKFAFTAAATTVFLATKDQLLGTSEVRDGPGGPRPVSAPGFFERTFSLWMQAITDKILGPIGGVLAVLVAGWGAIRLWFVYQRRRALG